MQNEYEKYLREKKAYNAMNFLIEEEYDVSQYMVEEVTKNYIEASEKFIEVMIAHDNTTASY